MVNAAEQLTLFDLDPVPAGVYGWGRPCWLTAAHRRPMVMVTVKGGYL